jgi:hypothetical protein
MNATLVLSKLQRLYEQRKRVDKKILDAEKELVAETRVSAQPKVAQKRGRKPAAKTAAAKKPGRPKSKK